VTSEDEGNLHRHPQLDLEISEPAAVREDLDWLTEDDSDSASEVTVSNDTRRVARLAALDPDDGISL